MKKINVDKIKWTEHRSPKGKFHLYYRDVAGEFLKKKSGPDLPSPPPLEIEPIRMPPGAANFPFHSLSEQWEYYLIVSGTGTMRAGKRRTKIKAGDWLVNPPGEPHQIINTGDDDLVYYVLANTVGTDVCNYPDSDKWAGGGIGTFRLERTNYYDGEE